MTNEEFFEQIQQKYEQHPERNKWEKKVDKFFDGFNYFNLDTLIEGHVGKLTHIGVNSMANSSGMIQKMTEQTLNMIEHQLKTVTTQVGELTEQFEDLNKTLHKKTGFFSSKTNSQLFFEKFVAEKDVISKKVRELNLKEHDLATVKNTLDDNVDKLTDGCVFLQRDLDLLNKADSKLSKSTNVLVSKAYKKIGLELAGIKSDLLTHQQIAYQKYAGIQILLQNVVNCHRNIKYISQVTHNVLMNIAELQQIASLGQSTISEKETASLKRLKETLTLVTTDLRLIAAKPFHTVIESSSSLKPR